MVISIIIPTFNEEKNIVHLIKYLRRDPSFPLVLEIIVIDGNSDDATRNLAAQLGVQVRRSDTPGRAVQMNLGASTAKGSLLYFLHADTIPPPGFAQSIWMASKNNVAGCFRLRFDWSHWFLAANSWFTRFTSPLVRFGDQSLFIRKETFKEIGGFNEKMKIFEDQDIIKRLSSQGRFMVMSDKVVTSARKYRMNGPYKLQLVYYFIFLLYRLGFSQRILQRVYLKLVRYPRVNFSK